VRVMRLGHLLAVAVVAVAACGGAADDATTSTTPGSTVTTEPTEPTETDRRPTEPTAPTAPTNPPDDVVVVGAPDSALLAAAPPDEIDWSAVGPGWILVDHPTGYGGPVSETPTLDERALYLVAPSDDVFGVAALPNDGSRIAAVSHDGRLALLETPDLTCANGCSCPDDAAVEAHPFGYALLDLVATSMRPLIDPAAVPVCGADPFHREVGFTADATAIRVLETWYTDDYHARRVRLSRVDIDTEAWTTILDEPLEIDVTAPPSTWSISVVELDDGRIVVTTPTGTWLREGDGRPVRALDTPDAGCEVSRAWDPDHVLARCIVPAGAYPTQGGVPAEQCRSTGLWSVALDGSPPDPVAIRIDDQGDLDCFAGYVRAEPIDGDLAIQVGGDGCSDDVDLVTADGDVVKWLPDIADPCTEQLLGVRNGAWLIAAWPDGDGPGAVDEVTISSSTRVELPSGQIHVI
jgi:hypothetical protein